MPGRHNVRSFGLPDFFRRPRAGLAVGVGLALVLLFAVALWSAANRPKPLPPTLIQPPAVPPLNASGEPGVSLGPPASPSSRSSSPAASSSPSPARSKSVGPSPSRSPTRAQTRVAPPDVTGEFQARYVITGTTDTGFQVGLLVTNTGDVAESWQVRVVHDPDDGVRFTFTFNADTSTSGSTTVLRGGPLAPGRTATVASQVSKTADGVVRPTSCTVNGRTCDVTVQ